MSTILFCVPIMDIDDAFRRSANPAWTNFHRASGWGTDAAVNTWLANEYNATLVNDMIVFTNEKDKIMWLLRWS